MKMKENNNPTDRLNEKFQDGKSFARSPELDHAAGDYEPLQDGPDIRPSDDPEILSGEYVENKIPFPSTPGEQIDHDERIEMEAVDRENEIEDLRANYSALDPDRN